MTNFDLFINLHSVGKVVILLLLLLNSNNVYMYINKNHKNKNGHNSDLGNSSIKLLLVLQKVLINNRLTTIYAAP